MKATSHGHVSYSSLTSWLGCGEKFRLTKIAGAQEIPAWWSIGGSAVHEATEAIDRAEDPTALDPEVEFHAAFDRILDRTIRYAPAPEGGEPYPIRASRGQDESWWRTEGPIMVRRWQDWRATSGWEVLDLNGIPAVEASLVAEIGGVEVKAFVDRFMVTPAGEVVVLDLKTGARKPDNPMQLGVYALLAEKVLGFRPSLGCYWMGRTGETTEPENLDRFTEDYLGRLTSGLDTARRVSLYLPNVSSFCKSCGVAYACWAVSGPDSARYAT